MEHLTLNKTKISHASPRQYNHLHNKSHNHFFCQYSNFQQKSSFYCFTLSYHTRTQFCTCPHICIDRINTSGTIFLCLPRYVNNIHRIPQKTYFSQRRGPSPPFLHHSEFFYMLLMVDRFPTRITYICKIWNFPSISLMHAKNVYFLCHFGFKWCLELWTS